MDRTESKDGVEASIDLQAEDTDEAVEELNIDVEDGEVWLQGTDFQVVLSPDEARQLAELLVDAAAEAESAVE